MGPDPPGRPDRNNLGRTMGMGQVGMEMAAPIVLGVLADVYLRWSPWGVVTGAVLGLVFGLFQLIRLAGQDDARPPRDQKPEAP